MQSAAYLHVTYLNFGQVVLFWSIKILGDNASFLLFWFVSLLPASVRSAILLCARITML